MKRAACTPGRAGLMNGPSRCTPRIPLPGAARTSRTALAAASITPGASVIRVGSIPVVPPARCAPAIVRSVSAEGASLNSTPPPPLTWTSMNPGARIAPAGSGHASAAARPRTTRAIEPASIMTFAGANPSGSSTRSPCTVLPLVPIVRPPGLVAPLSLNRAVGRTVPPPTATRPRESCHHRPPTSACFSKCPERH